MSHLVIHDDENQTTCYHEFDELDDAVAHLERLHNVEGIEDARLYALEPLEFAVTSYVKVQVGTPADTTTPDPAPTPAADETAASEEAVTGAAAADEAVAPAPTDASPEPAMETPSVAELPEDHVGSGEPRRGLFGR